MIEIEKGIARDSGWELRLWTERTKYVRDTLTIQDLIDLEARCAYLRMQYEGVDVPKEKSLPPPIGMWMEAAKIDPALLMKDLGGDVAELKSPTFTGTTKMSLLEWLKCSGLDFERSMEEIADLAPVQSVNARKGHVSLNTFDGIEAVGYAPVSKHLPLVTSIAEGHGTVKLTEEDVANATSADLEKAISPLAIDAIRNLDHHIVPEADTMGELVDQITGNKRRMPSRIARRALEEMVELCYACSCTTADIYASVTDSVHNQTLKASSAEQTMFPSQLHWNISIPEIEAEMADVRLVLLDLMHVTGIREHRVKIQQQIKFDKLRDPAAQFATDGHTFYLKKAHIGYNTAATE